MIEGRIVMWICPRCATHVKDDLPSCPCCTREAPSRRQIRWFNLRALPDLRKPSQSPLVWALGGAAFGLVCASITFHGSLTDAFLFGAALAVVFGLLGCTFRWRRNRWYRQGGRKTPSAEIGGILTFFLVLVLAVIDAFINHRGRESLDYLARNSVLVAIFGIIPTVFGALIYGGIVELARGVIAGLRDQSSDLDEHEDELPSSTRLEKGDAPGQEEPLGTLAHRDKITSRPEEVVSESDPHFGLVPEEDPLRPSPDRDITQHRLD